VFFECGELPSVMLRSQTLEEYVQAGNFSVKIINRLIGPVDNNLI